MKSKLGNPKKEESLLRKQISFFLLASMIVLSACARAALPPLMDAAYKGDLDGIKASMIEGTDVNARDEDGKTALMWAALRGHNYAVMALLEGGSDINAKDKNGKTALRWAVKNGHIDTVKTLLDNGADVDAKKNIWIASIYSQSRDSDDKMETNYDKIIGLLEKAEKR